MLPTFLDFIVWGHEHEAKPCEEEGGSEAQTTIYQPGSTVATSLCEGEAKRKAVGILEIYKESYRFTVRHLKTVRPFEIREVELADQPGVDLRKPETIEKFLKQEVEDMIETASRSYRPAPGAPDSLRLPLIRLKVAVPKDQTLFQTMSTQRFGQQFVGKVANPQDLLHLAKAKAEPKRRGAAAAADGDDGEGADGGALVHEDLTDDGQRQNGASIMNTLTRKLREAPSGQELKIFAEDELTAALASYVDKSENAAFEQFYQKAIKETQLKLLTTQQGSGGRDSKPEDEIMDRVTDIRRQRQEDLARKQRRADRTAALSQGGTQGRSSPDQTPAAAAAAGAGAGRRGGGRGRAAAVDAYDDDDMDEGGDGFDAPLPRQGSRSRSRSISPAPSAASARRGRSGASSQAAASSSAVGRGGRGGASKNRNAGQRSITDSFAQSASAASSTSTTSSSRQPSSRKRKQSEVAKRAAASRAADGDMSDEDDDAFEDDSGSENEDWGGGGRGGRGRGGGRRGGANAETIDDGEFVDDDDDDDELLLEQPAPTRGGGRKRAKTAAAAGSGGSTRSQQQTTSSSSSYSSRRRTQQQTDDDDDAIGVDDDDEEDDWGNDDSAASVGASGPSTGGGGGRFNRSKNKNRKR
jgi:double-strand break repair protein MRE11